MSLPVSRMVFQFQKNSIMSLLCICSNPIHLFSPARSRIGRGFSSECPFHSSTREGWGYRTYFMRSTRSFPLSWELNAISPITQKQVVGGCVNLSNLRRSLRKRRRIWKGWLAISWLMVHIESALMWQFHTLYISRATFNVVLYLHSGYGMDLSLNSGDLRLCIHVFLSSHWHSASSRLF